MTLPASDAAVPSCWRRLATCSSFKGKLGSAASAIEPALWRMRTTFCYTAQALQTFDLPRPTTLLEPQQSLLSFFQQLLTRLPPGQHCSSMPMCWATPGVGLNEKPTLVTSLYAVGISWSTSCFFDLTGRANFFADLYEIHTHSQAQATDRFDLQS